MNKLELFIRELPGTHFTEKGITWLTIREDTLLQAIKLLEEDHEQFLAEKYETEDEFWKEVYEDIVTDEEIEIIKENF